MFIKAPNANAGTGYVKDVNSAFRQGRQDAFRDYVDNFNFALQADARNNAENENQVKRAFDNYKFNLDFDQNTRKAMSNTVTESQKLADDVFNFNVDSYRLDNLYPKVEDLGKSKSAQDTATQLGAENTAVYKAKDAENKIQNADAEGKANGAKYDATIAQQQYHTNLYNDALAKKNDLDKVISLSNEDWGKQFTTEYLAYYKGKNPDTTLSDSEIMEDLHKSGKYDAAFDGYKARIIKEAQDNFASAQANLQGVLQKNAKSSSSGKTTQDKYVAGKMTQLDRDKMAAVGGGTQLGVTNNGEAVIGLPGGAVLVRSRDGKTGTFIQPTTLNGKPLSAADNAAYFNISFKQDGGIVTSSNGTR